MVRRVRVAWRVVMVGAGTVRADGEDGIAAAAAAVPAGGGATGRSPSR